MQAMKTLRTTKKEELDRQLLNHDFDCHDDFFAHYNAVKAVAQHYSVAENAIAVLSCMPYDVSYICYGHLGENLGLGTGAEEVASIWEKHIMERIRQDDVAEKTAWELQFLSFIKHLPIEQRPDYYLQHILHMCDSQGIYHAMRHRIFYLDYDALGNVQLSLCLYSAAGQNTGVTGIIHSLDDTLVNHSSINMQGLLSLREREILEQISAGRISKQIADTLHISVNTVNNHRQNIMRKLNCQNAAEAVIVATKLGILK